ncbi:MAG TPA: hypothetical protein VFJ62_21135 [Usitatibacter sp.]|nr:hypothetical protein [Usitatibacter sp.]
MKALRIVLLLAAAAALVNGVMGGLARLGNTPSLLIAIEHHGALMVAGFLGTVIMLERAVALARPWAWLAPAITAAGTLAWLFGAETAGRIAWVAGSVVFVLASGAIVVRQRAEHTMLLLIAAAALALGDVLFGMHGTGDAVLPWWITFLVLTIAAERLEMTRLMKRPRGATTLLRAAVTALLASALLSTWRFEGVVPFGAALVGIAAWLLAYDLARRTLHTEGFSRYAAVALLAGYAWLAVSGIAWAAAPFIEGLDDIALHALTLGFVFSMIFAHAPLVVPVIARVRMAYTPAFYVPLGLLHASVAWRAAAIFLGGPDLYIAGLLNTAAIVIFVAVLLYRMRSRVGAD